MHTFKDWMIDFQDAYENAVGDGFEHNELGITKRDLAFYYKNAMTPEDAVDYMLTIVNIPQIKKLA